jgi:small-conductance mechanosensitive channel
MSDNASQEIASVLILTAAQKQQVLDGPTVLTKNIVPDYVANYKRDQQWLIDLHTELEESQKDNSDYANQITKLECDLNSANTTIHILQATINQTSIPTAKLIELPHLPEFSGDCKELLYFISKVCSKLAGESSRYTDDQHKLCYVYGFLKGNTQNQIQPYVLPDKIKLDNVEALISILEAAFGDPNQVGTASAELDKLT